jgi:hypothetical protein
MTAHQLLSYVRSPDDRGVEQCKEIRPALPFVPANGANTSRQRLRSRIATVRVLRDQIGVVRSDIGAPKRAIAYTRMVTGSTTSLRRGVTTTTGR